MCSKWMVFTYKNTVIPVTLTVQLPNPAIRKSNSIISAFLGTRSYVFINKLSHLKGRTLAVIVHHQ